MAYRSSYAQRLNRRRWIWLILIGIMLVGLFLLILKVRDMGKDDTPEAVIVDNGTVTTAKLSVVGDITIDDALLEDALQPDGSYDFLTFFLEAAPYLYQADLTIGNLELNFAGKPYGSAYYSAPDELADTLQLLGFDILQTANSKTITSGISGMESTISTLKSRGITPLGSYVSKADYAENAVLIREINGIRIAFIAFTKGFDGMTLPASREYTANVLYTDYDDMYEKVNTAAITAMCAAAQAADPDVTIAMVHWGSAYKLAISDTQKKITNLLLNNGVDLILGSHSHVVGPMSATYIEGTDEISSLVCYSLGNFLSSETSAYTRNAIILNLEFSKNEATGATSITSVDFVPFYIYDSGENAVNRYCIKDLYLALEKYSTHYYLRVSSDGNSRLLSALDDLDKNTRDGDTDNHFRIKNPYEKEEEAVFDDDIANEESGGTSESGGGGT